MTDRRDRSTDALEAELRAFAHRAAPEPSPELLDEVLRVTQTLPQRARWLLASWPGLAAVAAIVVLGLVIGVGTGLPQRIGLVATSATTSSPGAPGPALRVVCRLDRSCDDLIEPVIDAVAARSHYVPIAVTFMDGYLCLADPFHPIACPFAGRPMGQQAVIGSAVVELSGTEERAFLNLWSRADGSIGSAMNILAPPPLPAPTPTPAEPPTPRETTAATPFAFAEWEKIAMPDPAPGVFGGGIPTHLMFFDGRYIAIGTVNAACCADGDPSLNRGVVWMSQDGRSWQLLDEIAAFDHATLDQILTDGTQLLVYGSRAEAGSRTPGAPVTWSSRDGVTWEQHTGVGLTARVRMDSGFLGFSQTVDATLFWRSSDGIAWSQSTGATPGRAQDLVGLPGGGALAVGSISGGKGADGPEDDAAAWITLDGTSWESVSDLPTNASMNSVVVVGQGLVAIGTIDQRSAVWTSTDGRHWEEPTVQIEEQDSLSGVYSLPDGIMLIGEANSAASAVMWISPDGVTWVRSAGFAGTSGYAPALVAHRDLVVAVGGVFDSASDHPIPLAWLSKR